MSERDDEELERKHISTLMVDGKTYGRRGIYNVFGVYNSISGKLEKKGRIANSAGIRREDYMR